MYIPQETFQAEYRKSRGLAATPIFKRRQDSVTEQLFEDVENEEELLIPNRSAIEEVSGAYLVILQILF